LTLFHREFDYPPLAVTQEDHIISGDDLGLLKGIGIDGKILHTPGHSRDSMSVVLSDGSAFVGDAAMNFLNLCRICYRPIFIEDMDAVFESWRKLIGNGAERIYPAHGSPFPAEKLTRSRNKFCGYDRRTVKRRGKKGGEDEYM
jgi:hydroxyacylglutathione hydrolase